MEKTAADFWQNYLRISRKEFMRYKSMAENAMAQLAFDDMRITRHAEENSIALLVKHITGNIRSRFTNFLTEDGEKPWRNRDSEFTGSYNNLEEMNEAWEKAWLLLFNTLDSIEDENWNRNVTIRNEPHNLVEAISRQLCHYASHVGQIVFIAKQIKGEAFKSLSIPRGASQAFNEKFFKDQAGNKA